MKCLRCVEGQFRYGDMPVTKPFMRVLVRQINKERAETRWRASAEHLSKLPQGKAGKHGK